MGSSIEHTAKLERLRQDELHAELSHRLHELERSTQRRADEAAEALADERARREAAGAAAADLYAELRLTVRTSSEQALSANAIVSRMHESCRLVDEKVELLAVQTDSRISEVMGALNRALADRSAVDVLDEDLARVKEQCAKLARSLHDALAAPAPQPANAGAAEARLQHTCDRLLRECEALRAEADAQRARGTTEQRRVDGRLDELGASLHSVGSANEAAKRRLAELESGRATQELVNDELRRAADGLVAQLKSWIRESDAVPALAQRVAELSAATRACTEKAARQEERMGDVQSQCELVKQHAAAAADEAALLRRQQQELRRAVQEVHDASEERCGRVVVLHKALDKDVRALELAARTLTEQLEHMVSLPGAHVPTRPRACVRAHVSRYVWPYISLLPCGRLGSYRPTRFVSHQGAHR